MPLTTPQAQLKKLLLRADGMEQFNALGNNRYMSGQMANLGAGYKEQEAALFKAAEAARQLQQMVSNRTPRSLAALTLQRLVVGQERTKLQKSGAAEGRPGPAVC